MSHAHRVSRVLLSGAAGRCGRLGIAGFALALCSCGPTPWDEGSFPEESGTAPPSVQKTFGWSQSLMSPPAAITQEIVGGDTVLLKGSNAGALGGYALGANGRHVLYLHMEGADVRGPGSNALENIGIRGMGKNDPIVEVEPFAPDLVLAERTKAILAVHKLVAGWYSEMNMDVVVSRPLSGDYMMTVMGGRNSDVGFSGSVVGISPGDCRNNTETDVNYAFTGHFSGGVQQSALTAAHEAGHALGLGHTRNNRDIMYPSVVPATDGFATGEVADPGPCGAKMGDVQDSKQVLIDNLGARQGVKPGAAGDTPPTIRFLSPPDLTEADKGTAVSADLTIGVSASAKRGLDRITISLSRLEKGKSRGGHPLAELRPPTSSAKVRISNPGEYLLVAAAYDTAGNVNLAHSRINVAAASCAVPNDCAPGQRCQNNVCSTPPLADEEEKMLRPYGAACERSGECIGGVCAATALGQICTHYCNPSRLCAGDLSCVDGVCMPAIVQRTPPKVGQLGGTCTRNQDCGSGECSAASVENPTAPRYCTRLCDPSVAWSCPADMYCTTVAGAGGMGNANRCVRGTAPGGGGRTGGCSLSTTSDAGGPLGFLFLLSIGTLLIPSARRRQHPLK